MDLTGKNIGFAITGSFCTISKVLSQVEKLVEQGANVIPVISEAAGDLDTRFGKADEIKNEIRKITKNEIISSITEAEPIGPKGLFDVLVIAPCTGNTIAKIANAITDTTVTMACKANLRNDRPVVIAVSTNDGLGANMKNIGLLSNMKNIYLVPFGQDRPLVKTNSLVSKMELISDTIKSALDGKQIQPVLV